MQQRFTFVKFLVEILSSRGVVARVLKEAKPSIAVVERFWLILRNETFLDANASVLGCGLRFVMRYFAK
jgi:hypothetical protein